MFVYVLAVALCVPAAARPTKPDVLASQHVTANVCRPLSRRGVLPVSLPSKPQILEQLPCLPLPLFRGRPVASLFPAPPPL